MSASDKLNREQLGEFADIINDGGGFSVKAYGPNAGDRAEHGYMVAVPGHGRDFSPGTTSVDDLDAYVTEKEALLREDDKYLGGWQGEDPVRGSVDVARRFPKGVRGSLSRAKVFAARSNQESIGEVGRYDEYNDIPNPNYDPSLGHAERGLSREDITWAFPPSTGPRKPSSRRTTIPKR